MVEIVLKVIVQEQVINLTNTDDYEVETNPEILFCFIWGCFKKWDVLKGLKQFYPKFTSISFVYSFLRIYSQKTLKGLNNWLKPRTAP